MSRRIEADKDEDYTQQRDDDEQRCALNDRDGGNEHREDQTNHADLPGFGMNAGDEGRQRQQDHQIEAGGVDVDKAAHGRRIDEPHRRQKRRPMQDLRPDQLEPLFFGRRVAPADINTQAAIDRREQLPVETGWLAGEGDKTCLLYTSPSPRDLSTSRMPSSA